MLCLSGSEPICSRTKNGNIHWCHPLLWSLDFVHTRSEGEFWHFYWSCGVGRRFMSFVQYCFCFVGILLSYTLLYLIIYHVIESVIVAVATIVWPISRHRWLKGPYRGVPRSQPFLQSKQHCMITLSTNQAACPSSTTFSKIDQLWKLKSPKGKRSWSIPWRQF